MGFRSDKNLIFKGNKLNETLPVAKLEKVDGDQLIETLILQRFNFNKSIIKNGFDAKIESPKITSIINNGPASIVSFSGFDYLVKKNKVIGVNGIELSPSALATITEKVVKLDQMQQYCCAQANLANKREKRDLNTIKTLDRQYFAALRAIRLITENIADLATKSNASFAIETAVAKTRIPDIKIIETKTDYKGGYVAEVN
ncbi:hypothetical protein ASE74_15680 [Pedobacter sp. Leaf216]|nr:hypothetical protein ASE74_15680 [Pedobacter sp. Leaf216]